MLFSNRNFIHRPLKLTSVPKLRIVILYSRLASYMVACLRALKQLHDVELLIYQSPPDQLTPFDDVLFADLGRVVIRQDQSAPEMLNQIRAFFPQAVYMAGWMDVGYLKVARELRKDGVPVIAGCDRQWTGTIKQRIGQLIAPWYLHSAIDILWVAGERQRQLASRLGYRGAKCWSGIYCCDWESFAKIKVEITERPRAFLYVGRYIKEKGMTLLIEAYHHYRNRTNDPWPLICVGTGPEAYRLTQVDAVRDMGFIQPKQLPELMGKASALVLPSMHEPWGVVIQEAAATGLPLICSDACGATVHLLQDNYNGFLVEAGNVENLTCAMIRLSELGQEKLTEMSQRSLELSKQFTPDRWSRTFIAGIRTIKRSP